MEKGIEIIIVCAVLAAAVVGVGIFLTVHFCCQRRNRRQHSPSRGGYAPQSGTGSERQRRLAGRQGRTRSPASRNGGVERPPPPPPTRRPPVSNALAHDNCRDWLLHTVGSGLAPVDVHQPGMSMAVISEVSNAAATLNYSQHTYQTVPGDSLGSGDNKPVLEGDECEPPKSPPPPPPSSAETRLQRKERELRCTQEVFPGVLVKEEQLYELRAIFSDPQLSRSATVGVPTPGASVLPHPSSAPPWSATGVHQAVPARAAVSTGEDGVFSQWPTTTAKDAPPVSFVGPALTDGGGYGSGFSGDTAAKQLYAPSQKTSFTRPPPHGSGSNISGIVFTAKVADSTTTATIAKQRHPDPPGQTYTPDDQCRLPDGSPPRPRYVLPGVGGGGSEALPPPSTDCRTCRAAKSPPWEPPPLPPRPVSVAVCGHTGGDALARNNTDLRPDLNIERYLCSLPAQAMERRCPADGDCAAATVTVAIEEYAALEQPVKPYSLLGPNSLRTS